MNIFKKVTKRFSFLGSFKAIYNKTIYSQVIYNEVIYNPESKKDIVFILVTLILTVIVFFIPTGFEESAAHTNAVQGKVRIIHVDNEYVRTIGPVRHGHQRLEVQVLSRGIFTGKARNFTGNIYPAVNDLIGKMEMDKLFTTGEVAFAVFTLADDQTISMVRVMDHYRTDKTIILAVLFITLTILIMGWMGIKIVLTFVFSASMLIKVLYPLALHGYDPIIAALLVAILISAFILFLVGGLSKRALSAFLGTSSGIVFTAILSFAFTHWFKIHGAVRPFAEMLLYTGYGHINLVHLFIAGIFIAASGAMMDLAMNIAAAMDEIKEQQQTINRLQLIKSGYIVARQAAGTMSTTLLLAYSAEYTAMIMVFIAQGIPLENIINMVLISAEVVHTLVGCFGLTLVAPFTVIASGMLLKGKINK